MRHAETTPFAQCKQNTRADKTERCCIHTDQSCTHLWIFKAKVIAWSWEVFENALWTLEGYFRKSSSGLTCPVRRLGGARADGPADPKPSHCSDFSCDFTSFWRNCPLIFRVLSFDEV